MASSLTLNLGGIMKLLIPVEILKAATVYMSRDKTRYNINCLSFEGGNVIATNGTSLLVWRHGAELNQEGNRKNADFLMNFDKASLKFLKAAHKACIAFTYDTETRVLSDGYGQSITLHEPPLKGDFPEWRKSAPDVRNLTPVALAIGTKITETYAEYAKARKGKNTHGFTVLTTADYRGSFYLMPYDLTDCFIVAMPLNDARTLENHLETIRAVSGGIAEVIAA